MASKFVYKLQEWQTLESSGAGTAGWMHPRGEGEDSFRVTPTVGVAGQVTPKGRAGGVKLQYITLVRER